MLSGYFGICDSKNYAAIRGTVLLFLSFSLRVIGDGNIGAPTGRGNGGDVPLIWVGSVVGVVQRKCAEKIGRPFYPVDFLYWKISMCPPSPYFGTLAAPPEWKSDLRMRVACGSIGPIYYWYSLPPAHPPPPRPLRSSDIICPRTWVVEGSRGENQV